MGKIYIIQICSFLLTMINIFVELHGSCKCTSPEHIQFDVLLWKPVWKPWTLHPIVCWASWTPHNFELYIFRVLSLKDSDVLEGLRFLSTPCYGVRRIYYFSMHLAQFYDNSTGIFIYLRKLFLSYLLCILFHPLCLLSFNV